MKLSTDIPFAQVRERAYELWERNHRPEGFEIKLWLLAERELKADRDIAHARRKIDDTGEQPANAWTVEID